MSRFFFAALCALSVFGMSVSFATEGTGAVHLVSGDLPLERAVQIALRQNPDILKQLQEIERTKGQVIAVRAQALPRVAVAGNFEQQDVRLLERGSTTVTPPVVVIAQPNGVVDFSTIQKQIAQNSKTVPNTLPGDKSWRVDLEVKQVIYAGGQVRAALNIAKFTEDSSYYQLRDTIDQVVSTTRVQFYDVLLTRALIKVQEESVQLLGDQLKDQQNRFEAGTVPRFNVLRAEVALANQQPELIKARNNYLIAQLRLAKTLNLDPGPQGKPTFNCVGEFDIAERPLGLQNAIQTALERRAFLKVQRQQILIAKEQIKVELAGYKPRVDANAGYEWRNSRFSDQLDDTVDGWFYGITGSWNIFDGLETYGRVKQARSLLESSKINYDDAVHQVELEVQQSYSNLRAAREVIRSQQKNVEQALEALRLANERFSAGAGTQLDVLDARTSLTQARTTEIQSRAAYNAELAVFDRVTSTDTVYAEMFKDPLVEGRKPKTVTVKTAETVKTTATKKPATTKKADAAPAR